MKTINHFGKNEEGSALVVGIFAITMLLGFLGLAMDLGNLVVTKTKMQNAVDAAAYAGAMVFTSNSVPPSTGDQTAATTKVNTILANNGLSVTLALDTTNPPVVPPPANTLNFATDATYNTAGLPEINLSLSQNVPTYFLGILGVQSVPMSAQAEAVQKPGGGSGGGGWGILEIGNGNVNISGNVGINGNVGVNGNGNVSLSGSCGVAGNLWVNGNGSLDFSGGGHSFPAPAPQDHPYCVTGSVWDNGNGPFTMSGSARIGGPAYIDGSASTSFGWSTSINGDTYGNDGFAAGVVQPDASGAVAAVNPYAQAAQTAYNDFITRDATGTSPNPTIINNTANWNEPVRTITGVSGDNVVNLSSLNISGDGNLTLSGPADASFIINVAGDMSVSGSGYIKAAGGLSPDNITWVHQGTGTVNITGGSEIDGNILSPNGAITLSGNAQYYGTLISGQAVTLSGSVHSPRNVSWLVPGGGASGAAHVRLIK